jgi:hypothetical protein
MNNRIVKIFVILFSSGLFQLCFGQLGPPDVKVIAAPFKNQKKARV